MSLANLVTVKKTQRDKDWPMIRRLVEADLADTARRPHPARVAFWLRECRTPELLRALVRRYPAAAAKVARSRPAVRAARRSAAVDAYFAVAEVVHENEEDVGFFVRCVSRRGCADHHKRPSAHPSAAAKRVRVRVVFIVVSLRRLTGSVTSPVRSHPGTPGFVDPASPDRISGARFCYSVSRKSRHGSARTPGATADVPAPDIGAW
jgi:hypothetical protein